MTKPTEALIALADRHQARIVNCEITPGERCRVADLDKLEHDWEGHQHGRPSPKSGRRGNTDMKHDEEEAMNRFAKKVVAWLDRTAPPNGHGDLVVFAPPRFMGALRKTRWSRLDNGVQLREADLTSLDRSALAQHPEIRALVGLNGKRG